MAKQRPPKKDANEPPAGPFHSAFSGLAALRDQLPAGQSEPAEDEPASRGADDTSLPKKVVVRHERKGRKGKTITRVTGFGADAAAWARRMKQELGCGGSVEDGDVILAGDLVERSVSWLESAGVSRIVRGS